MTVATNPAKHIALNPFQCRIGITLASSGKSFSDIFFDAHVRNCFSELWRLLFTLGSIVMRRFVDDVPDINIASKELCASLYAVHLQGHRFCWIVGERRRRILQDPVMQGPWPQLSDVRLVADDCALELLEPVTR